MIKRWYNVKRLDRSKRAIRRKIKSGLTINLNTYLEEINEYSL